MAGGRGSALSRDGRTLALSGAGEKDTSGFTVYRFVDIYTRPAGGAWAREARLLSKKRVLLDIDDFFVEVDHVDAEQHLKAGREG